MSTWLPPESTLVRNGAQSCPTPTALADERPVGRHDEILAEQDECPLAAVVGGRKQANVPSDYLKLVGDARRTPLLGELRVAQGPKIKALADYCGNERRLRKGRGEEIRTRRG